MPLPTVERGPVQDKAAQRLIDKLVVAVLSILKVPVINGKVLESLAITTSATNYPHGLGRLPKGWMLVSPQANTVVYEDRTLRSDTMINLRGSSNGTVDVWVF